MDAPSLVVSNQTDLLAVERTSWELGFLAGLQAGERARYVRLERLLAGRGGGRLLCAPEEELPTLLERGAFHEGAGARRVIGEPSRCHANAAALFVAEGGAIGTGYALSGGIWRQHSWWICPTGRIAETTLERELYFGLTLTGTDARRFAAAQR